MIGKTIDLSFSTVASPQTVPRQLKCVWKKAGTGGTEEAKSLAMTLMCFAIMHGDKWPSIYREPIMSAIVESGWMTSGENEAMRTLAVMLVPSRDVTLVS